MKLVPPLLRLSLAAGCAAAIAATPAAWAQTYDDAIDDYKAGNYEDAASTFYALLRFEDDPGIRAEAEYGLARSFAELGLHVAALKYYEDIVSSPDANNHPYFDKAVEGLIDLADLLRDDLKIPPVMNAMYDRNRSALGRLPVETIQRLHYMMGTHSFNRGIIRDARDFLGTVKEGNPKYAHAQYMLGLIRLGLGRPDAPPPKYDKALAHFEAVRSVIDPRVEDDELRKLRDLATLGLARTLYERAYLLEDGDPEKTAMLNESIFHYRTIPRFSEAWPDAIFERSWSHTVSGEYGKALGALHNFEAPYFEDRFYPESDILRSIIYYYNCQWDRVTRTLDEAKAKYAPMVERMEALAAKDLGFDEWYALLNRSIEAEPGNDDPELIPWAIAKYIAREPKFQKMETFLQALEKEGRTFEQAPAFSRSEMGREMTDFAFDTREAFIKVIGKYVKTRVIGLKTEINDVVTRVLIVSLETKTAEAAWLEQGREVGGQVRSVLPRPSIPDETFQFWWFRDEYWIDELGYFESVIKTECFE